MYSNLAAISDVSKMFAVDLISGSIFGRTKIAVGDEGIAVDVSAENPMPVSGTVALDGPSLAALETVSINGNLPGFASTPTFNLGTLNGAATAAAQAAGNVSLANIDGKLPDLFGGAVPVAIVAGGGGGGGGLTDAELRATPVPVSGTVALDGPSLAALETISISGTVSVSFTGQSVGISGTLPAFAATPTFNLGTLNGAATAAAQTTGNNSLASIDGKLPAALGAAIGANSLTVVTNSDFARTVASSTLTRLANATAYVAGQIIGGSATVGNANNIITFAGAARVTGGAIAIRRIRMYKSNPTALGAFHLYLFRASPTLTAADAAAMAGAFAVGNATATARLLGRFSFDMTNGVVGSDGAEVEGLPLIGSEVLGHAATGSTDIFAVLVAATAYTPASGETFSFLLEEYSY